MAKIPKNQTPSNKTDNLDDKILITQCSTNTKWIIGLLILVILLLATWLLVKNVTNGDRLLSALENFSTILSIILSISSIAFAGYTSIETGRQFHDMSKAVEEIRTSNRIMSDNYAKLLEHYHDTVNSFSKILNRKESSSNKNDISGIDTGKIKNS